MLILTTFSLVVAPVLTQSDTATATVRSNPLEVEVSAPFPAEVSDWFNIEVTITNKGAAPIAKTFAKIHTPSEIKARGKKKRIGTLTSEQIKIIWQAKANQASNYVIRVDVAGFLGTEKIYADNSTLIEATNSILLSWLRILLGL